MYTGRNMIDLQVEALNTILLRCIKKPNSRDLNIVNNALKFMHCRPNQSVQRFVAMHYPNYTERA